MSTVDGTVEQTSRWVWTDYRTEEATSAQLISCPDRALHSGSQPHQLALLDRVQGLAAVSTLRSAASSTEGTLEGRVLARAGYPRDELAPSSRRGTQISGARRCFLPARERGWNVPDSGSVGR